MIQEIYANWGANAHRRKDGWMKLKAKGSRQSDCTRDEQKVKIRKGRWGYDREKKMIGSCQNPEIKEMTKYDKTKSSTGLFQTYCWVNSKSLQYSEYHEKSSHMHFFFWFPVHIKASLCYNVVYQACNSVMSKKSINHNFKNILLVKMNHHLSLQ